MSEMLARLETFDPELRSFVTITGELALQQAQQADKEIQKNSFVLLYTGFPLPL